MRLEESAYYGAIIIHATWTGNSVKIGRRGETEANINSIVFKANLTGKRMARLSVPLNANVSAANYIIITM